MKLGNTRRKSLDTFDICEFYHSELKRGKRPQKMSFEIYFEFPTKIFKTNYSVGVTLTKKLDYETGLFGKVLKSLDFCQITLD